MKGFGKFCIWLGTLSLIGALIGGHSAFGPAFWLALGLALVFIAKQKEDVNRKMDGQVTETQQSISKDAALPKQEDNLNSKVVENNPTSTKTNVDIPMTTKQKEAAMCLISYFGGYNDDIETNPNTNEMVYTLSYQASIYFQIHNYPEMLPGAMSRNSDPDKMFDTVMTIEDRQYKEFLLLTCYDLSKMSGKPEAFVVLFNIAGEMGYSPERFKSLIQQYTH